MARIIDLPLTAGEGSCDPRAVHGTWGALDAAQANARDLTPALRAMWEQELAGMRVRIKQMREALQALERFDAVAVTSAHAQSWPTLSRAVNAASGSAGGCACCA